MSEPSGPLVRHERRDDGVDLVTLSHGKVNALSVELLAELHDVVIAIAGSDPRAVVLTGGPKLFAAGADITQFAERGGEAPFTISPPERVAEIGGGFLATLNAVAALPCPTIAVGIGRRARWRVRARAGVRLPDRGRPCPVRPARDPAGHHPGRWGYPAPGPVWSARPRAKDLVFSGRQVDAAEALAMGLVDRVVDGDPIDAALEMAAAFAAGANPPCDGAGEVGDRRRSRGLARGRARAGTAPASSTPSRPGRRRSASRASSPRGRARPRSTEPVPGRSRHGRSGLLFRPLRSGC